MSDANGAAASVVRTERREIDILFPRRSSALLAADGSDHGRTWCAQTIPPCAGPTREITPSRPARRRILPTLEPALPRFAEVPAPLYSSIGFDRAALAHGAFHGDPSDQ